MIFHSKLLFDIIGDGLEDAFSECSYLKMISWTLHKHFNDLAFNHRSLSFSSPVYDAPNWFWKWLPLTQNLETAPPYHRKQWEVLRRFGQSYKYGPQELACVSRLFLMLCFSRERGMWKTQKDRGFSGNSDFCIRVYVRISKCQCITAEGHSFEL